ncbi:hypothetical protein [Candidatus Ferrigenium straubiae]|jgi:hypothetical protein|uniref:hypothetical protein n=1 Tax=Candidatus Ferrigenium straubiae TaxID=2919506 RepID=UPI003F4AA32A
MSLVINLQQYEALTGLRKKIAAAISDNNAEEMHRAIGMVHGYLIGLFTAGEIDINDVNSLEAETMANVDFLLNVRKVCNGR